MQPLSAVPAPGLLSLRRLAAAEHSSVLPCGPWPQISRGAGLAPLPVGAGCPAQGKWCQWVGRGAQPCAGCPSGDELAVWPGLVAARVQHYDTWLPDQQGPSGVGGSESTKQPSRGSRPPLPSGGLTGAELRWVDGAGGGCAAWGHSGTVSNGDSACGGSPCLEPEMWQGMGLCQRWWWHRTMSHGSVASREPWPRNPLCQGREMAAAVSRHGPGSCREQPVQRCPGPREHLAVTQCLWPAGGALISALNCLALVSLSGEEGN